MFHVRRRPADCAPRKRKKKPGALGATATSSGREPRLDAAPVLVELGPDGSAPSPGDNARSLRLTKDVMEVGSANGIDLQLYGPHIQPRHAVIANTDGLTSITPCHADAHTYVNGQRIHQTTILSHGNLVKFGHSNAYRFLDPSHEGLPPRSGGAVATDSNRIYDSRSPIALSPAEAPKENFETTFDLEGNVETVSTASGPREDNRSLGSASENRLSGMDRYPRGQDPILPAVLEFPEEPQEQFLARVITHLDVTTPTFRLAPAYTLYLCARYRASTHYRPELTPTERAHKLTLLLQHAAMLIRHTVQDRSTESTAQAFWLANASELLHFLKSDRHVSAFSIQAQDTLADGVQLAFRNLVACLTGELNTVMSNLVSDSSADDHPRELINVLGVAMNLLRKCRVNAALTIQLFSQLFHWISARALSTIINNPTLCTRSFGMKLFNKLRNLQAWAESQGLELAAECHLAKIVQCAHLLQAPKNTAEELANLSAACFKLNSLQLRALLTQYKAEPGEQVAPPSMLEQAARAAEGVADELARAEGREVRLHEDPAPPLQLLLPDDGFSCDVVQGVPPGLADFLQPLQASGLCRLATQPTSSGHWTVYMNAPRPPSALSTTQPEVQVIRLHKAGGGMGLSIVAAKGAGQERLGIYIKSVVPGGAADRDGRLAAGDQLLSVDGQSLLGITQEKAAEFLVRTGSVVTLEVAKGGAVYHGLATLLQQPSPTPNRAWDLPYSYYQDSDDSLTNTPKGFVQSVPAMKPKSNVFFNSDDSLYKTEMSKLTVPRIQVEQAPEISVEVTDFSQPVPKTVEIATYPSKPRKVTQRSTSLDRQYSYFEGSNTVGNGTTNLLRVNGKKSSQSRMSSSLQELSSSTSSMGSAIHESNLDLTQIDPNTPIKRWKSPDCMREGNVKITDHFEDVIDRRSSIGSVSYPELYKCEEGLCKSKSFSAEQLNDNKLTDYERREVLKVLYDWSISGSESKTGINFKLKRDNKRDALLEANVKQVPKGLRYKNLCVKFKSESDLSPEGTTPNNSNKKYSSACDLQKLKNDDFFHECPFKYCIFNKRNTLNSGTNFESSFTNNKPLLPTKKLKGILKNSKENLSSQKTERTAVASRRHSDIPISYVQKPFNNHLVRFGSLEKLNQGKHKTRIYTVSEGKKFPDSYIVTKKSKSCSVPCKVSMTVVRKKSAPKTWKSCSDIKSKQCVIKKCCRNAKNTCPLLRNSLSMERRFLSCDSIDKKGLDLTEYMRLANFDRPRRMSERDLPSRVDSERSIPSSKSVPALHHISPGAEQPSRVGGGSHDVFNPGYSRTSSNNSINTNSAVSGVPQNGTGGVSNPVNLRSRSTHNLHQDSGFYQNLSIYRNNNIPNPQQLGDRASALRSSQNSLQSSVQNNPQRPVSAYYPQTSVQSPTIRSNLHQSIPNLKSPPSTQRLQNEESRSGSYPSVNQQYQQSYVPKSPLSNSYSNQNSSSTYGVSNTPPSYRNQNNYGNSAQNYDHNQTYNVHKPNYNQSYGGQNQTYGAQPQSFSGPNESYGSHTSNYSNQNLTYGGQKQGYSHGYIGQPQNQGYMGPNQSYSSPNYSRTHETEINIKQPLPNNGPYTQNSSYPSPTHSVQSYSNGIAIRSDDANRYGGGLLREDVFRHSQLARGEEMMRYPSSNSVAQAQQQYSRSHPEERQQNEMRTSRSDDMLRHHTTNPGEMMRYASSGNIRSQESSKVELMQLRQSNEHRFGDDRKEDLRTNIRGQAKLAEMGEELRRRQNRILSPGSQQHQHHPQHQQNYQMQMDRNIQNLQNINLSQQQNSYSHPSYYGSQTTSTSKLASKMIRKTEDPPELPPVTTHPLYTASLQDPPKMAFYPNNSSAQNKLPARDPWAREEQERQAEVRREQARQWQEQQIRELMALPYRTPQQEEQLRVLQLEREFQRRALEAAEQDDDDTEEKESPASTPMIQSAPPTTTATSSTTPTSSKQQEHPPSILKPGATTQLAEPEVPPPPPERGSSFVVMSMHNKEAPKRVTFDDSSATVPSPKTLAVEETVREDPNSFIRQAESMLASSTTPVDSPHGTTQATPGVIGAQEVYRDPRARRLAEQQAQNKPETIPEKLSFKEKMKMFAMETGEAGTPKDKSKISRAQREIDNLGSPGSGLVH